MLNQQYLVIDYGTTHIKGMLVSDSFGTISILRTEMLPLVDITGEDEYEYNLVRFIQSFFPEEKNFILNLPTDKVIIRDIVIPLEKENAVWQALPFAVESLLPYPIETVSVKGSIWKKEEDNTSLVTFSSHHNDIVQTVLPLKRTDTQLKSVYTDLYSLAAIIKQHHINIDEMNVAQLDMGGKISIFNVIQSGKLLHSRYFNLGGDTITTEIARYLEVSYSEAEEIKLSLGFIPEGTEVEPRFLRQFNLKKEDVEEIRKIIISLYDSIIFEVLRSFHTLKQDFQPTVLYLSGGSSLFTGIEEYFGKELSIKIARYTTPVHITDPLYATCIGASYRCRFKAGEKVEFLDSELSKKVNLNRFNLERFRPHVILLGLASILYLTVFIIGIIIDKKKIKTNEASLIQKYEKGFETKYKGSQDVITAANNAVRAEKKKSEIVRLFLSRENVLDLIMDINNNFPDKGSFDFMLDNFVYSGKDVQIFGRVHEFNDLGILEARLKKSRKFSGVEVSNKRLIHGVDKYKVSFKVKLELPEVKEK